MKLQLPKVGQIWTTTDSRCVDKYINMFETYFNIEYLENKRSELLPMRKWNYDCVFNWMKNTGYKKV